MKIAKFAKIFCGFFWALFIITACNSKSNTTSAAGTGDTAIDSSSVTAIAVRGKIKYIGTSNGNVWENSGSGWSKVGANNPDGNAIKSIAVDRNQKVYAETTVGSIWAYDSSKPNASWQLLNVIYSNDSNIYSPLVLDKENNNLYYIGTLYQNSGSVDQNQIVLWRYNSASGWASLGKFGALNNISALTVDSGGNLYAGDGGNVYKISPKTLKVSLVCKVAITTDFLISSVATDTQGNIYASYGNKLKRCSENEADGVLLWEEADGALINTVAVSDQGSNICIGTAGGFKCASSLNTHNFRKILLRNDINNTYAANVSVLTFDDGVFYWGTFTGEVFSFAEPQWQNIYQQEGVSVNNLLLDNQDHLYAAGSNGVLKYESSSSSWTSLGPNNANISVFAADPSGNIYIVNGNNNIQYYQPGSSGDWRTMSAFESQNIPLTETPFVTSFNALTVDQDYRIFAVTSRPAPSNHGNSYLLQGGVVYILTCTSGFYCQKPEALYYKYSEMSLWATTNTPTPLSTSFIPMVEVWGNLYLGSYNTFVEYYYLGNSTTQGYMPEEYITGSLNILSIVSDTQSYYNVKYGNIYFSTGGNPDATPPLDANVYLYNVKNKWHGIVGGGAPEGSVNVNAVAVDTNGNVYSGTQSGNVFVSSTGPGFAQSTNWFELEQLSSLGVGAINAIVTTRNGDTVYVSTIYGNVLRMNMIANKLR